MYTYKIVAVDTAFAQVDNRHFLDVTVDFYKEVEGAEGDEKAEVAFSRKYGYSLETTKEEIVADLDKQCATFTSDEVVAADSAALEEKLAGAEALKQELLK